MLFPTSALKKCVYFNTVFNKYYNIQISALPRRGKEALYRIWAIIKLFGVYLGVYSRGALIKFFDFFYMGAYSLSHKIWGGQKKQFKKYTLLQLLS